MKHHGDDTDNTEDIKYHSNITSTILAIDVGSSSVRCTAYYYSANSNIVDVLTIPGCSSSAQIPAVEPTTGTIRTNGLLDAVDCTVNEVLSKLRAEFKDEKEFRVEAVGFSTFVMNLVAVNDNGQLVTFGEDFGENKKEETVIMDDTNNNTNKNVNQMTTVSVSYACNAPEVNAECHRLRQELGPDALDKLYEATGAPLHSAYALPQLRVLYKDNQKSTIDGDDGDGDDDDDNDDNIGNTSHTKRQSHRWQSVAGYCLSRWSSRRYLPISYSEASWTGLLNVRDCVYEKSAIRLLPPDCRAALPELADFTDYVRGIPQFLDNNEIKTNPYWTKFPELCDTKFFLGIGDGACANVGSKCTNSSRIAVTIGTSAAARTCLRYEALSSSPSDWFFRIPECRGLFCYRIDRNHVLVGGALTDGGSIVEWASRFLNLDKDKTAFQKCLDQTQGLVAAEYQQQEHQHRDLIMAPFLSGERSTGFRDGAAGAVFGLTRETTPAHFFKSCLEGVSLRLKAVLDLLLVVVADSRIQDGDNDDTNTTTLPVIVASGKAMEVNNLWRQMIADSSGLRVVLDEDTAEGTSRGVARLVAISLLSEREAETIAETSTHTGCNEQQQSLVLAQHEEKLRPFITSEPRPIATAMYAKKARLQESFVDSISPFFSS